MDPHTNSTGLPGFPVAQIGNDLPDIVLSEIEREPRARDLDIADRLGFERSRDIRKLIERNLPELETFGVCATVAQTSGEKGGRPSTEYWLNEEQALLISARSDADNAPAVRRMLIKVFVAWRRGTLTAPAAPSPREHRLYMTYMEKLVGRLGLTGKEAVFAANRATAKVTGIDVLAAAGIQRVEAETDHALLTAGDIGAALGGISAQRINKALTAAGYQIAIRTKKGRIKYEPTETGKEIGGQMVMIERSNETGTALQLLWASTVIEVVRGLMHAS
jgi:hypothetical protein